MSNVGEALAAPFLPAAPHDGACTWCDYRDICGPFEEPRSRRKSQDELNELTNLRCQP